MAACERMVVRAQSIRASSAISLDRRLLATINVCPVDPAFSFAELFRDLFHCSDIEAGIDVALPRKQPALEMHGLMHPQPMRET